MKVYDIIDIYKKKKRKNEKKRKVLKMVSPSIEIYRHNGQLIVEMPSRSRLKDILQ